MAKRGRPKGTKNKTKSKSKAVTLFKKRLKSAVKLMKAGKTKKQAWAEVKKN